MANLYREELGIGSGFSIEAFSQSEFLQMASLVDINNKDAFQIILPEKLAQYTEGIIEESSHPSKLQNTLLMQMISQGG